jgi:MFS family permease
MRILPEGTPREARLIFLGRGFRAFGDGFVSLLLPVYLTVLGFNPFEVGVLMAATLLGSALLTLGVGFVAPSLGRRHLLVVAALLMIGTGIGFLLETRFWPLVLIGFVGTLNPSSGDVSLFLPLEHAALADLVPDRSRTMIFAFYSVVGSLVGALGSLAAGVPELLVSILHVHLATALQAMFAAYTVLGLASYFLYRRLPPALDRKRTVRAAPLGPSRGIVFRLATLFCLDSFASGLAIQSLLALWLFQRFGLSLVAAGSIFFWSGVLAASSSPISALLAKRIGLVNTMVFTHLPAHVCLVGLALAPNLASAIAFLLMRALLSQMDVPARTSYVMAVVTPEERPAAASVTLVPRSLATAVGPVIAGYLLSLAAFPAALVLAGGLKVIYDLLLLAMFRRHRPPEESAPPVSRAS